MAGQLVGSIDTSALGILHDAQLDYYGKRVAVASNDHTVCIWDITDPSQQRPMGELKAHEGPVWRVSWAHPMFGSLLATCGYDMKVIIWKEAQPGNWQIAYMDTSHTASVNDVQFCPREYGLRLACASSDGTVSVLSHGPDQQWRRASFPAHQGGAQSVSWAPVHHDRVSEITSTTMRLATGGCDSTVAIWKCDNENWMADGPPLPAAHTDWVRVVAWQPDGSSVVASGSWDKSVIIWAQEVEGQPWRQRCRFTAAGKVEGLSWSVTGSILAVSCGESETTLYKEAIDGKYEEVAKVNEPGFIEVASSFSASIGSGVKAEVAEDAGNFSPPAANSGFAQQQQAVLESFQMM
mmetsp:Transcript_27204/g.63342  ORF Transcript_27204/g.63342 Transcript_27204/m.63342 type:complete len:351 (+) Transcript_27204:86-1138(+)